MKKNSYIVLGLLTAFILSCSTDLDDVEARLKKLEENASKEEPKYLPAQPKVASIKKFGFLASDNPVELMQDVVGDVQKRDIIDSSRAFAPLKPAEDSILLDTSNLTIEETREAVLKIIKDKTGI